MNVPDLKTKALTLARVAWDRRDLDWPAINRWLGHFSGECCPEDIEKAHALYLFTQFTYFGSGEIRELLRSVYRDLVLYPMIETIRVGMSDSQDVSVVTGKVQENLKKTRFVALGGPSSSGAHLLYLFRQVNKLDSDLFLSVGDLPDGPVSALIKPSKLDNVDRLVFLDDICGTGHTVEDLWNERLETFSNSNPSIRLTYLALLGLTKGLEHVRQATGFSSDSAALYELDDSYSAQGTSSRYVDKLPTGIDKGTLGAVLDHYSKKISSRPYGYEDCGLLMGFHHNTPDNTLPLFWEEGTASTPWCPPFKRFKKDTALP